VTFETPGCYGLPTAVSANSQSCRECPVRGACVFEATAFLESLPTNPLTQRERLSLTLTRQALASTPSGSEGTAPAQRVVASSRGVKRIELTPGQLGSIAALPQRVGSQVKKLMERGWFDFARQELHAGRNPASKGWQRVFCSALLAGGASRSELELALVESLDLSEASARVQVSVGMAIFAAGRVATERFGKFSVSPN